MGEKKNNKVLIWLIIILIILVLGLVGFIVYDKVLKVDKTISNNDETTNLTTTTTNNATTDDNVNDNTKYEKISTFKLNLNGKEHNLHFKYFLIEGDSSYTNPEDIKMAQDNGEYAYYTLKVDVYIDENIVKTIPIFYDINDNKNEVMEYIGKLNTNNIKILNGADNKEYLVFLIKEDHGFLDGRIIPFISNSDGKLLYEFDYQVGGSMWVEDPASKLYSQKDNSEQGREYLIEKDRIYFLTYGYMDDETHDYYLQQNILTIRDDKINIEKGNYYKGNGAGQI